MHSLPIFVRLKGMRVLLVGEGPAAEAKARLIVAAGGIVVQDGSARLAFVALDNADDAAASASALRLRGLLVNVVDRPELCDFTIPAIVDRSPVIVAIGTGGASASLAKALRERLEALLPARLGELANAIFASRGAVAVTHPTVDSRRRLWDAAMAPGGPLDPFAEDSDLAGVIAGADGGNDSSLARIVLTSSDPDDMTLRQLRMLNQADTIFHGAKVPAAVLDRARRDAERVVGLPPANLPAGRSVLLDFDTLQDS